MLTFLEEDDTLNKQPHERGGLRRAVAAVRCNRAGSLLLASGEGAGSVPFRTDDAIRNRDRRRRSDAPADNSPAVDQHRTVEIVVYVLLLALALAPGLRQLAQRHGLGEGRPAERLPAVLSVRDPRRCVTVGPRHVRSCDRGRSRQDRSSPATSFGACCRCSFRRFSSALAMQWLGLYVASFLLVAGFMRFIGRIAWWKSLLTSVVFAADHVRHVRRRVRRHHAQGSARSPVRPK